MYHVAMLNDVLGTAINKIISIENVIKLTLSQTDAL